MQAKKIRIVIADDHPLVREGLRRFLGEEEGIEIVAECADGEEALETVRRIEPDILLLDIRMPRRSGIEVAATLSQAGLDTKVILLAATLLDADVIAATRAGVRGMVLKEMAPGLLLQAIRKVAAGGVWIEKESASRAIEHLLGREEKLQDAATLLSARELEIVKLANSGLRNREIGEKLFIGEGTVKSHLHTIYEKLGIKSRLELVAFARERGLQ